MRFECLKCGHCCERIVIEQFGIHIGLCLLPGEKKLFKAFQDAVVPYIGLRKPGRDRIRIVCHQMIRAPCPLYDSTTRQCTRYEDRPVSCRAYPFSGMPGRRGGYSVEQNCSWTKSISMEYGTTTIQAGAEQDAAAAKLDSIFAGLSRRMHRDGWTELVMFDVHSMSWVELVRGDEYGSVHPTTANRS